MHMTRVITMLVWLMLGAVAGVVADYYLYRAGLPMKPFVYQAF
jgi:hypothetical protein